MVVIIMVKEFIRKDMHKKKRISGSGWRKPKGITNKRRLNRKGHSANVRPGYGSPGSERNKVGLLEIVTVYNIRDFDGLNPKSHCVLIGRVGKQKKLDLIAKAEELAFKIVNLQVDKYKKDAEAFFAERKESSKAKDEEKKKKEAAAKEAEKDKEKKKAEDDKAKEEKEEELSDEEKKKLEKKEKDKILTQKNSSGL